MRKIIVLLISFISIINCASAQNPEFENILYELPDVIFKKIESTDTGSIAYELRIKQPVDHENPEKGYFYQRAFLNHMGFENPTVFVTEGYTCSGNWPTELSMLLDANQIAVEHRYFGESIPDTVDYTYLNLKQVTADLHHVNMIFKAIYPENWVSTGISKGGATTIFYRYFYPEDVDVSVPYVAPINDEYEEDRIYTFLKNVGTTECREKIKNLQLRLLKNKEQILPLIKFYSKGARLNFTYLSVEEAYEYAVLEYPFSFFQWGSSCDEIPSDTASIEEIANYLLDVSGVDFYSDRSMQAFASHYYQSLQEMGYYGYEVEEFKEFLSALPTDSNPYAAFAPNKMDIEFDGSLLDDINAWLPKHGNQFIYIYGAMDTWTASAVQPSKQVDALWFFMEGENHGSARIRNLNEEDKAKLISSLEKWLEIDISESK